MRLRTLLGPATAVAYAATIPTANLAVEHFGPIPVWFGPVLAPSGVLFAGLALALRDAVRELLGKAAVLAVIAAGVVFSFALSAPALALASAASFALSETLDFAVYEKLRKRGMVLALAASNVAGLIADSVTFLLIAFGSLAFLPGQILGKMWMTVAAIAVVVASHRSRRTRAVAA